MDARPLVLVVDDDESVRESLPDLLKALGYRVQTFSSAEALLASAVLDHTDCLILDMAMPGMTGLELYRELKNRARNIPVIFITAHKDSAMRSRIMDQGAVECLYKPFTDTSLLAALEVAVARS